MYIFCRVCFGIRDNLLDKNILECKSVICQGSVISSFLNNLVKCREINSGDCDQHPFEYEDRLYCVRECHVVRICILSRIGFIYMSIVVQTTHFTMGHPQERRNVSGFRLKPDSLSVRPTDTQLQQRNVLSSNEGQNMSRGLLSHCLKRTPQHMLVNTASLHQGEYAGLRSYWPITAVVIN